MNSYVRAHIALDTQPIILNFLKLMGEEADSYVIENEDGSYRANARSILGLMYMATEHPREMFVRNMTNDGSFPSWLDSFRMYGTPSTEEFAV